MIREILPTAPRAGETYANRVSESDSGVSHCLLFTACKAIELLQEMRFGNRPIYDDEVFVIQPELGCGETLATPVP